MLANIFFFFVSLAVLIWAIAALALWLGWWALLVPVTVIYLFVKFFQHVGRSS
jgi:hypothetical protein